LKILKLKINYKTMLVTSRDIFWLALSFVILWAGICLGFCAFYCALMMRDFRKITASIKKKLDLVDQILAAIKNKVGDTASYIPPLIDGVSKLSEAFRKRQAAKATKKSRRRRAKK